MASRGTIQVNIRLPQELVDWLDREAPGLVSPELLRYRGPRSAVVELLIRQEKDRRAVG
jgi:hypothetical protein